MVDRILSLVRKEFLHIIRDPRTLGLALVLPVIDLLVFGYAINVTVEHVPTVVVDQANDRLSREFVTSLINSNIFDLSARVTEPAEVRRAIDRGEARVGIVIPPDF